MSLRMMLVGLGQLFDFHGTYASFTKERLRRSREHFSNRSDTDMITADWEKVGGDLRKAMEGYDV